MPRRPTSQQPPEPETRDLTRNEIDRGINKLRRRSTEIEGLDPNVVRYDDAKVDNVESNIRETIRDVFGSKSPEFNDHGHFVIWHGGYNVYDDENVRQRKFAVGRPQAITKLEGLIARLEERREDAEPDTPPSTKTPTPIAGSRRVFVVHGRDDAAKETVARFLEHLHLKPVVLHEQPNHGRTIIEKFEH